MSEITSTTAPMMMQLNGIQRDDVRTFCGTASMLYVDEEKENTLKHHASGCIIDPDLFGFSLLGKVGFMGTRVVC